VTALAGIVGAPALTVGLFGAVIIGGVGALFGGALALAGVVLLAKGGQS
jgi:hypothetical protein